MKRMMSTRRSCGTIVQRQKLSDKPKTDTRFHFVNFLQWFFHVDCSQIMPVETAPFAGNLPATESIMRYSSRNFIYRKFV